MVWSEWYGSTNGRQGYGMGAGWELVRTIVASGNSVPVFPSGIVFRYIAVWERWEQGSYIKRCRRLTPWAARNFLPRSNTRTLVSFSGYTGNRLGPWIYSGYRTCRCEPI